MTETTVDAVRLRYQICQFWLGPILFLTAGGNFLGLFSVLPQMNWLIWISAFCLEIYIKRIEKRHPEIGLVHTTLGRIQQTIVGVLIYGMLAIGLFKIYEGWNPLRG
jgi:hypothetical protein